EAKPERAEHAVVGLHHQHMPREFGPVLIAIGDAAAPAVLLVGPEHAADGAARPQVELLHDAQRLPRHHAAPAIVGGARTDVPRVEMAADDNDFVRAFAPANL